MEQKMKCKECKIICDGKEIAKIECTKNGMNLKCTDECKELFEKCCR